MTRWIRFATAILLLLLAGAISNILVAWIVAGMANEKGATSRAMIERSPRWLSSLPVDPPFVVVDTGVGWRRAAIMGANMRVGDTGLPWRSMRAVKAPLNLPGLLPDMTPESPSKQRGVEPPALLQSRGSFYATDGLLPTVPVFPGFLLNTLLYSLILGAPYFSVRAMWRRVRVRNGRCARCGYDLAGLESGPRKAPARCPECGRN